MATKQASAQAQVEGVQGRRDARVLQQIQPLHLLMLAALLLVQCVTSAMGPVSAMSLLFPVTHWHSRHASPFPDTLKIVTVIRPKLVYLAVKPSPNLNHGQDTRANRTRHTT